MFYLKPNRNVNAFEVKKIKRKMSSQCIAFLSSFLLFVKKSANVMKGLKKDYIGVLMKLLYVSNMYII